MKKIVSLLLIAMLISSCAGFAQRYKAEYSKIIEQKKSGNVQIYTDKFQKKEFTPMDLTSLIGVKKNGWEIIQLKDNFGDAISGNYRIGKTVSAVYVNAYTEQKISVFIYIDSYNKESYERRQSNKEFEIKNNEHTQRVYGKNATVISSYEGDWKWGNNLNIQITSKILLLEPNVSVKIGDWVHDDYTADRYDYGKSTNYEFGDTVGAEYNIHNKLFGENPASKISMIIKGKYSGGYVKMNDIDLTGLQELKKMADEK